MVSKTSNKTSASKTSKLTPYQQETLEALKKLATFKLATDANIVSAIYKRPDILYDYQFQLEDFTDNIWRVYWQIAYDIVIKENKQLLDEITVGIYLEKHPKLQSKYQEYGGYETIVKATEYIKIENVTGYVEEQRKWNTVIKLIKDGFPAAHKLSEFADMSLEEIYSEYDAKLNHVFINADDNVKSYSIRDNLDELIEELNEGLRVGLPYYNLPLLNKETGGMLIGNITLIGALSNVGKSSFIRNAILPSIIEHNEKIVVILNEEDHKRWKQELLVWCGNTIFHADLQKFVVRDGKYSDETKEILNKCIEWIQEKTETHTITLIPLTSYNSNKAIKIIKKYASLGIKYFCLDTLKPDSGDTSENVWFKMQQSMVDIYNVVKESNKNVHLVATFQLGKAASNVRHYTAQAISTAKNIIDVVSTCIMIRSVYDDEYEGEKRELRVFRLEGKNLKTKIPVKITPDKNCQLLFIIKNRNGAANKFQIVAEHDLSRNILKEIGITSVPLDW